MWLSMLSVWASLLTLVASQSCQDQSEDGASWVRLKPLGQCKDGESTCPYRITLSPLTIQLPKSFRELDKMARELRSLTELVNQLREDCHECKERHGMDWNIRTDGEGEDGEKNQAFNTRGRAQDIAKRESTIKMPTARSALEDTMIINSDAKDMNPTFGTLKDTTQERNINPRTNKPRTETDGGSNPLPEKTLSGRMSHVDEVAALKPITEKIPQSPAAKLTELPFSGDLDSEQPTQHEKPEPKTIGSGHETYPSGTLNAKGKVKSIPEYHVNTKLTEDDDDDDDDNDDDGDDDEGEVETKQPQTPKGDKILGERRQVPDTDAQNNREPNMKQVTRKQEENVDNKEVGNTGQKETRTKILDATNSGSVANEGSVSVIQQPTLKNKEKTNHGASATKPKAIKPGVFSERDAKVNSRPVNTADTMKGQKKLTSSVPRRVNTSINVSQITPQTLEIKPQTDPDAKMNTGIKLNTAETESEQMTSRSRISGIAEGLANIRPINPQILPDGIKHGTGGDSESETVMNSSPKIVVNTVDIVKDSTSHISDSVNVPPDTATSAPINPELHKGNTQTSFKYNKIAGKDTVMNSNPVSNSERRSGQVPSRSSFSGVADSKTNVSPTSPQKSDSKKQLSTGTDSESDAVINVDSVSGLNDSSSFISDRAKSTTDVDPINPQSIKPHNRFTHGVDIKSNAGSDSRPFSRSETVGRIQIPKSAEVHQTHPGSLDGTFKKPLTTGTDKARNTEKDSKPLNRDVNIGPLEMPQISVTGKADATSNVDQINIQTVNSDSEKTFNPAPDSESEGTVVSSPRNKVETINQPEPPRPPISGRPPATADQINPQAMDNISKMPLNPGTTSERKTGMYPNRDHTPDTVSQRETSGLSVSDARLDVSDTKPGLDSNDDLRKKTFLPKLKLNMTQFRNGRIRNSNPARIDPERIKALQKNKTVPLRGDNMGSGRYQSPGRLPMRTEVQQKITNQTERNSPTRLSASKDPRHRKPYILQEKVINKSKAFGSGGPKNTSTVIRNRTMHVGPKTVPSPDNMLNSIPYDKTQSVMPTLATQEIVDQAHIKRSETAPTVQVSDTMDNHQIESTSQTTVTKPRLELPGGTSSGQDLLLDTVNNFGRDTQPPVVGETKSTNRRTGKTPFRTMSADYKQETQNKPPRVESIPNLAGKMAVSVGRSGTNELNYPATAATPYTIKTEFDNKHHKMPQLTPPITTTTTPPKDPEEEAKTTPGVKMSNKPVHHRHKNHSQEIRSHSDTGNKKLQSASNGQGSGAVIDLHPSSLDSIQNQARVKATTGSKVSTMSTESTNENRLRDKTPVEASTEANWLVPSSDDAPAIHHRRGETPLGSADAIEGNNGGQSLDNNNGNSFPDSINGMNGATLHKIPDGLTNYGDNKKPLTVNNMDDRQGLEKQLLHNCQGRCDLSPTPRSILNSRESSNNDRAKSAQDCSDFMMRNPRSGIYNVTPTASNNRKFPVLCDMKTSGGGWTVIQHRFDGSIVFNRTWNDYKKGFGKLTGEFWLGNDKLHWLTTSRVMVLRVELEDLDGVKEYAQYNHFHVANESQYYRLTIEGYSGTAGDAMLYSKKFNHNQKNFTTPDRDNDQYTSGNCGNYYSSGWWFDACMAANLNGKYYKTKYRGVRNGIFWGTWHNISTESYPTHDRQSFKTVRMMIRPRKELLIG